MNYNVIELCLFDKCFFIRSNSEDKMPVGDALILVFFGILLPSWDVYSDIALSYTLITPKVCSWDGYVKLYKNGIEPAIDPERGI